MPAEHVTGAMLWANLHLLFWLSLFPFATGWMGENHFAATAHRAVRRGAADGRDRVLRPPADDHPRAGAGSVLEAAVGRDWKGKLSPVFYIVAIGAAFWSPWVSGAIYVLVALIWLIPDRRIERVLVLGAILITGYLGGATATQVDLRIRGSCFLSGLACWSGWACTCAMAGYARSSLYEARRRSDRTLLTLTSKFGNSFWWRRTDKRAA